MKICAVYKSEMVAPTKRVGICTFRLPILPRAVFLELVNRSSRFCSLGQGGARLGTSAWTASHMFFKMAVTFILLAGGSEGGVF